MERVNRIVAEEIRDFIRPDSTMLHSGKLYLKEYSTGKLKDLFGKEYYMQEELSAAFSNSELEPIKKFLCNIIPNFETKYIRNEDITKPIIIEKIDYNTFIYISTDIFIPNKSLSNFVRKGSDRSRSIYDANTYIYIFGKKSRKYTKMLDKAIQSTNIIRQKKKIAIVSELSNSSTDISTLSFDPRDMDTLIYSHNEMEIIKDHLDKFMDSRSFYKYKQLNYKTGILLYGIPGNGKSTICKVLANMYNRNIIQISIPTIDKINFGELTRLINNDDFKYIVLLEDIDTLYLNRDDGKADKEYNNIINNLLQFLDSNTSPNDVIFICTTNHIDRLDEALLRAGRIDLKVEIKGITEKDIDKMLDLFNLDHSLRNEVIEDYKKKSGKEDIELYNQSELQKILLSKIKNIDINDLNLDEE